MASIGPIDLAVNLPGGPNAEVTATYTITFSSFDINSGLAYRELAQLIADDTDTGDVNAGVDTVLVTLRNAVITANGDATISRSITRMVATSTLNEDPSLLQPRDELRAKVTLTPQVNAAIRESDQVTGRFV